MLNYKFSTVIRQMRFWKAELAGKTGMKRKRADWLWTDVCGNYIGTATTKGAL